MANLEEPRPLRSAFDSPTFGEDTSFKIDQPVGSMSISPCGRDVVLGSKEGLYVIDLDSPYSPPRYLPHHTPWEVADVQWSPFAARDAWVISTSNQKALVWNLSMPSWEDSIEHVLHGHTRAITDINFSAHCPDVLATCAVDSFVHCWDLRTPARPVISFSDWFAGATQVKWNRQDPHILASSHDKFLRIWDDRMGAYPLRTIKAHSTKIYGIDWNRLHRHAIATCSLDKKINFWNFEDPDDVPERTIDTGFPVWRARHTPFGWGILAMPQRGNFDLHLYDRRKSAKDSVGIQAAAARYPGHSAQVKEFLWRPRGTITDDVDNREFQLVTWGADHELRLHRIIPETMEAIGYERGVSKVPQFSFTRRGARYKTFRDEPRDQEALQGLDDATRESQKSVSQSQAKTKRAFSTGMSKVGIPHSQGWAHSIDSGSRVSAHGRGTIRQDMNPIAWMKNVKISSWDPETLGEEITQVGEKFTKVLFEFVDVNQRKTTISMQGPWAEDLTSLFLKLDIKFPKEYPRAAAPEFNLQKTASITDDLLLRIKGDLGRIADMHVQRRRGCLEAVLRYLLREQDVEEIIGWISDESVESSKILAGEGLDDNLSSDEDDEAVGDFPAQSDLHSSDVLNTNVLVPVAKACGALWAHDGRLVCFFPPKKAETSFLHSLNLKDIERSHNERVFEGFGRLQTDSPGPKGAVGTVTTADDDALDLSDTSSTSSSSSSGSSDILASLPTGFLPPHAWRSGALGLQRSRSADQSQRSLTGLGAVNTSTNAPPNIVSLHRFDDLLPAHQDLARSYRIFGESVEVCKHNAAAAERSGRPDASACWEYLSWILEKRVPLESTEVPGTRNAVLTRAHQPFYRLWRRDRTNERYSALDTCHPSHTALGIKGAIRWGRSTFGSEKMIPQFFKHFESVGDIQMLAMLSCVLYEPRGPDLPEYESSSTEHPSLYTCAPGFTPNYFPSSSVAQAICAPNTGDTSDKSFNKQLKSASMVTLTKSDSVASPSDQQPGSEAVSLFTPGTSPSLQQFQDGQREIESGTDIGERSASRRSLDIREKGRFMMPQYQTSSLSSSPNENRFARRSNSNLAFSLSRVSLNNLVQSYSHSPPSNTNLNSSSKKRSPDNIFTTGQNPSGSSASQTIRPRNDSFPAGLVMRQAPPAQTHNLGVDARDLASSYPNTREAGPWLVSPNVSPPKAQSKPPTIRSSRSSIYSMSHPDTPYKKRRIRARVTLRNQDVIDCGDGADVANLPLLDQRLDWKFRAYREEYANLLNVWHLQNQRKEVLKFNAFDPRYPDLPADRCNHQASKNALQQRVQKSSANSTKTEYPISVPNKASHIHLSGQPQLNRKVLPQRLAMAQAQESQLGFRRHCANCGDPLAPVWKNGIAIAWYCVRCSSNINGKISTKRTVCTICQETIRGLLISCLNCGHVSCLECSVRWFSSTSQPIERTEDGVGSATSDQECPAACGCICSHHQYVDGPWPQAPRSPLQYSIPNSLRQDIGNSQSESQRERLKSGTLDELQPPRYRPSLVRTGSSVVSADTGRGAVMSRTRSHTGRSMISTGEDAIDDPEDEDASLQLGAGFGRRLKPSNTWQVG